MNRNINAVTVTKKTNPPTTPPAMAPTFGFECGAGVVDGEVDVDGDWDEDVDVDELELVVEDTDDEGGAEDDAGVVDDAVDVVEEAEADAELVAAGPNDSGLSPTIFASVALNKSGTVGSRYAHLGMTEPAGRGPDHFATWSDAAVQFSLQIFHESMAVVCSWHVAQAPNS